MRQNTKFNLRIVRTHQSIVAFTRQEQCSNLTSFFRTDRNILQIRIGTAEAPRSRYHLIKRAVNAFRFLSINGFKPSK